MIDFRENDLLFGNESNGMNLRFYKYNKYIEFIQTEEGKLEW